jgi:hypothetical protein
MQIMHKSSIYQGMYKKIAKNYDYVDICMLTIEFAADQDLYTLRVSWAGDVSALSFYFGRHVLLVAVALTFNLQANKHILENSQIDMMVADVAELINNVATCLCSSRLYISLVHNCQPMLCYRIKISYGESNFAPCLLLFVPSRTENAQIKIQYPWKAFCSAMKLLSSSKHCPNQMLMITNLKICSIMEN